jgi:hypothetical protein
MNTRLTGVLTGLMLVVPAMALAKPPEERDSQKIESSFGVGRINAPGGAEAINTNMRSKTERKWASDGKVKARSQVVGTLVDMRSKVMYVRVNSGAVVPIDGSQLSFHKGLNKGDELRATFVVDDDLTNVATGVERAVSTGAGG